MTRKRIAAPLREPRLVNPPISRGLRIEDTAAYSGLSPFYVEELIRSGRLLSVSGPRTGRAPRQNGVRVAGVR
jgi:hypothetical protein